MDLYPKAAQSALVLYDSVMSHSQHLYNGNRYYVYDVREVDHPFLMSREWGSGELKYDGQLYSGVQLKYDINKDWIVIKHFSGDGHIGLQNDRVGFFGMAGHVFYRFRSGVEINSSMPTGYYDMLYDGKSKVISRRTKIRYAKVVDKKVIVEYVDKDFFYLLHGQNYFPVYSKKSVLSVLGNQKSKLKKFARNNRLRFRKQREASIVKIAAHYDELTAP